MQRLAVKDTDRDYPHRYWLSVDNATSTEGVPASITPA